MNTKATNGAATKPVSFRFGEIAYHDIQAVSRSKMEGQAVRRGSGIDAAAKIQACPITAREATHAAVHFPIVFTPTPDPVPIVVMSLEKGRNPFVTNGEWTKGIYVPAAIRRYPFILGEADAENRRPLCIDVSAVETAPSSEMALVSDGNESEHLKSSLNFCLAYQADSEVTARASKRLDEEGLLVPRSMTIDGADGSKRKTGTFKMIDTEALNGLPDETVLTLHRSGLIGLVHAHLISLGNVAKVAALS